MSVDRAVARVNLDAIAHNCGRLRSELREGVELCAVVKADGYGHGLLESAHAALAGGAKWLAVASVPEARELIDEVQARLLVLGPLRAPEVEEAVFLEMEVVAWQEELVAISASSRRTWARRPAFISSSTPGWGASAWATPSAPGA